MTLDRFRDSGRNGVNSEFQATTTAPDYKPHLTIGQINLTALRTRTDFAKRLDRLYPEANWDEAMETVCVLGLRHLRQGEPILRLSEQADIKPPSIRLAPLVHDGLPTVLFGPGGIGKSYLALFCSMLVEHGGWEAGLCGVPGPTLYVDYESDYSDLVNRAKKIRKGHPALAGSEPLYRRCHIPLADDLPALQRLVAEAGIRFLVIDSLAAACGAELERAETAIRFFSALRS
ncbi:MAG: AAA family ATPase [Nitrospirota bacterium]